MKLCHNVVVRVFSHPVEDEEQVKQALLSLFPFSLALEKVKLVTANAFAADERSVIKIFEVTLVKDKLITAFLESLTLHLNAEQKAMLIRQENRLDEDCNFFLRLDKQRLFEGVYWITDEGNCYHIRLTIAAYPKKKETAREVVKMIFSK